MPKVYLRDVDRQEARARSADQALRVAVATRVMAKQTNQRELAARIGLTPPTMSRRMAHPDTFTLRELRRIAVELHFTQDELTRCL